MFRAFEKQVLLASVCGDTSFVVSTSQKPSRRFQGAGPCSNCTYQQITFDDVNRDYFLNNFSSTCVDSVDAFFDTVTDVTNLPQKPLCVSDCDTEHVSQGRVVANPVEFMVSLQLQTSNGWSHSCGGTMIAPTVVLSAAHCVVAFEEFGAPVRAVVGPLNLNAIGPNVHVTPVVSMYAHPAYKSVYTASGDPLPHENDIALFYLEKASDTIVIVPGPWAPRPVSNAIFSNNVVGALGWGMTSNSGSTSSVLMAIGNLTVTNDTATCDRLAQTFYRQGVGDDAVCIVTNRTRGSVTYNQDTCRGDSGGPVIAFDGTGTEFGAQVGIVSWGGACPSPLGIYTRVIDHTRWILDNVASARGTPVPSSGSRRLVPTARTILVTLLFIGAIF